MMMVPPNDQTFRFESPEELFTVAPLHYLKRHNTDAIGLWPQWNFNTQGTNNKLDKTMHLILIRL